MKERIIIISFVGLAAYMLILTQLVLISNNYDILLRKFHNMSDVIDRLPYRVASELLNWRELKRGLALPKIV